MFQRGVFQAGVFQGADNSILATLNAQEQGADTASITAETVAKRFAALAAQEQGGDTAQISVRVSISGALAAQEQGADSASIEAGVTVSAALSVQESGADTASIAANTTLKRFAVLAAQEVGADTAVITGTSEGFEVLIPRDVPGGVAYLISLDAYDTVAEQEVTLRYGSVGFNSRPTDTPANAHWSERVLVPGDYDRALFSSGTTSGDIRVGAGVIELANADGGLDDLIDHAFDGYALRIQSVPRIKPSLDDAELVFRGTMEQAEFPYHKVRLIMRDRLAEMDKPIQTEAFAGTTTDGTKEEAEGGPDLKDKPEPLAYGAPRNVEAPGSNSFNQIFSLGQNGLAGVAAVRSAGVLITESGDDYSDAAALVRASVEPGQYATALGSGLVKIGGNTLGVVTFDPVEGATAADRTAAQIARRIMLRMGLIEGKDFRAEDVARLDALNPAEIGYWLGTQERTALRAAGDVLNSIGASLVPDRLGVFRMYRFEAPTGRARLSLTPDKIIEQSAGIERKATGDEGRGVPAWKVTLRYAPNGTMMDESQLADVDVTDDFRAFAAQDYRVTVAKDEGVKAVHRLASELSFDTHLCHEADAIAEAQRRLAIYSVRRDRFAVPVKSYLVEQIDINDVVELNVPRFGLNGGKLMRVIGLSENLETGITTLDLYG